LGVALVAGAVAHATIPDAAGVVHGCIRKSGALRLIDTAAGKTCKRSETGVTWNQGPVAYGHVLADGTLDQDSGNMTVARVASGVYCIGITGATAHVAVASLDSLTNLGGTVQAGVFHLSGCPDEASDIEVVTRAQAQDGGIPGTDRAFYIIVN